MQTRLINQAGQQGNFVIVLDSGDEVMACLKRFVEQERVDAARFIAIGAFRSAVLGIRWETKDYQRIPVDEQAEVAAFTGDVAYGPDDQPSLHIHCVLGCRGGRAVAVHLLEATFAHA